MFEFKLSNLNFLKFDSYGNAHRTPHTTHHTPHTTHHTIILFVFLFTMLAIPQWGFGQIGEVYYLKAHQKSDLTPINKTENGNYLTLTFQDAQLNSIFQSLDILDYENFIEGLPLCKPYDIDHVFVLILEYPVDHARLLASPLIKSVKAIPQPELSSGELPNDYYIPTFDEANQYESPGDSIRNDYLDLIQAPCAWELTKGHPDILVGISDSYFSEVHVELQGKFDTILVEGLPSGGSDLKYKHGIEVANLIAGNTNNEEGTASIGYNTRLVGRYPHGLSGVKHLVRWSKNNGNKIKVINMSWHWPYDEEEKALYKCFRDQYDIVLVAAGGNKIPKSWNDPNDTFHYPASYESVISVTTSGSRYPREDFDYTFHNPEKANLKDVLFWDGAMYEGKQRNHQILNDSLDLAAPSYDIYRATNTRTSTNGEDSIDAYEKTGGATSTSAPLVSGTAALMLAANPDLTAVEVKDILKFTADRIIPYHTINNILDRMKMNFLFNWVASTPIKL